MEYLNSSVNNDQESEVEQIEQDFKKIQIGFGVSSTVYIYEKKDNLLENNENEIIRVHKQFKEEYSLSDILNESQIHQLVQSDNVIKLYHTLPNELILEYAQNGDLFQYVRYKRFSEKLARTFFKQLIQGMKDIHSNQVCHRDIKLDNLLLDENYNLKISDFGWATKYSQNQNLNERAGTEDMFPPEMIDYSPYQPEKVDVFLCGIVLFTMVVGISPINQRAKKNDKIYKYFANNQTHLLWKGFRLKSNLEVSDDFKNLIEQLLHYNYKCRPNFDEILQHEWLTKGKVYESGSQELKNEMQQIKQIEINIKNKFNLNQVQEEDEQEEIKQI